MGFFEALFNIPLMFYFSLAALGASVFLYARFGRAGAYAGPADVGTVDRPRDIDPADELPGMAITAGIIGFSLCLLLFAAGLVQDYRNSRGIFYPDALVSQDGLPPATDQGLPPAK